MPVNRLRLRGFRGFRDAAIDLKPLTVLLGPNSAGKSSFGHALAALSHAQRVKSRVMPDVSLTPETPEEAETWPVDLGELADLRTVGTADRVYIDLDTSEGTAVFGFGLPGRLPDLRLSYIEYPASAGSSSLTGSSVLTSDVLSNSRADDRRLSSELRPTDESILARGGPRLVLNRDLEQRWVDSSGRELLLGLKGLDLLTVSHRTGTPVAVVNDRSRREIAGLLEGLQYLRGSRKRPSRGYERSRTPHIGIGYAGEYAADIYDSRNREIVRNAHPVPGPTSVENAGRILNQRWDIVEETLSEAVAFWLQHLHLAGSARTEQSRRNPNRIDFRLRAQRGGGEFDITEIGFGVSQVLPVLLAGLTQSPDSMLVVDLPEAHLHPRPQGPLADFFCAMVHAGKRALVETHSPLFFHQLRLRVALQPDLVDRVAVYFIDEPDTNGCSEPRAVPLDKTGEFEWPRGFLQEGWELETQIQWTRRARSLETSRRG